MKIFLNWKQNGSLKEVAAFIESIGDTNSDLCLFLPYTYLHFASSSSNIIIGAQNVSSFEKGPFTGEIGAMMLKDCGVKYCLVGHSERRKYFLETKETLSAKIKLLEENLITPVLCIGETWQERSEGSFLKTIEMQMQVNTRSCIIAYEPVWAIGTGVVPSPIQIKEVADFILQNYGKEILYGGSVSENNLKEIASVHGINGVLVGSVSLNVEKVKKMISFK